MKLLPASISGLFLGLVLSCASPLTQDSKAVFATIDTLDSRTVVIRFSETIDQVRSDTDQLTIISYESVEAQKLLLESYEINDKELVLRTEKHQGGTIYSISLGSIEFEGISIADAPSQINFIGFGRGEILVRIDTRGYELDADVELLATLDPSSGRFQDRLQAITLSDEEIPDVFTATLSVQIDEKKQYALRAQTIASQSPISELSQFTVTSTLKQTLNLNCTLPRRPEFSVPTDRIIGDAKAPVRIIVDDRFARELQRPMLRLSINENGEFDLSSPTLLSLRTIPGYTRVYETTVEVAVDQTRKPDGTTELTFPYIAYLVENDEDFPARGIQFVMPEEQAQTHVIPMGNPLLVPVTFRIDAGQAWLEPDGETRGLFPQEALFLTGEFPSAEDSYGRIAADAFTGGERASLRMKRRPDAPDIFEKTVFMKPDRPYGWKVVRCPAEDGCSAVNRRVTSSGRAFPTVMKNLVSENLDAASNPSVTLIDPASPGIFANALVSTDGAESPSSAVMFKQEAPDLVVYVGQTPVITPIHVVGTWRDVNIPTKPIELVEQGGVVDLNPYDYDSGWIGLAPLVRSTNLPIDPGPEQPSPGLPTFEASDGQLDNVARQWTSPAGRLPLWLAWNETELYVASSPAPEGSDHFILVTTSTPSISRAMPWAKAGDLEIGEHGLFLAMEGDGNFHGWFQLDQTATDPAIENAGAQSGADAILEGSIELALSGASTQALSVWIAVISVETNDGGNLRPGQQNPAGNNDFKVDTSEFIHVPLTQIRAFP